ncbi:MAG: NlpC/P60 family protein [Acidimicrobiales bacterium]
MKAVVLAVATLVASPVALATVITGPTDVAAAPSAVAEAEIPADLLPVYMAAADTCRGLPWQVLAAVGWVESRHAGGRADPATGAVAPPIIGPAIDGSGGFRAIPDASQPDGWAHALGPMQFLSTTWTGWATLAPDRPPGASPDVNNAWDAIFAATRYLCGGRDQLDDVRAALRRYNRSDAYVDEVMTKAEAYGLDSGSPVTAPLVTGSADAVIAAAMTQLGVPYVWGAETPAVGFDCSGLVQWAYAQAGITVPRTTQQQVLAGVPVPLEDVRPGDLVFSRSVRGGRVVELGHIAIYVGGGKVIVAPRTGTVVRLQPISPTAVQAVRRVLA